MARFPSDDCIRLSICWLESVRISTSVLLAARSHRAQHVCAHICSAMHACVTRNANAKCEHTSINSHTIQRIIDMLHAIHSIIAVAIAVYVDNDIAARLCLLGESVTAVRSFTLLTHVRTGRLRELLLARRGRRPQSHRQRRFVALCEYIICLSVCVCVCVSAVRCCLA